MDARTLGAWVQGAVLGVLLFLAFARLFSQVDGGGVVFRYQGF
ncbi:MAG: hypothetical protein AAF211_31125 [Myxococcota bacterium]